MIEAAYEVLRVDRNASPEDVRSAYLRLVRRYPPEHFPEKFAALRNAYQTLTLSDDFLEKTINRMQYDDNFIGIAACLWGDRKELKYAEQFNPEELLSLLAGEDARRVLDELLASVTDEVEWKTGGME